VNASFVLASTPTAPMGGGGDVFRAHRGVDRAKVVLNARHSTILTPYPATPRFPRLGGVGGGGGGCWGGVWSARPPSSRDWSLYDKTAHSCSAARMTVEQRAEATLGSKEPAPVLPRLHLAGLAGRSTGGGGTPPPPPPPPPAVYPPDPWRCRIFYKALQPCFWQNLLHPAPTSPRCVAAAG